MCPKPRLPFVVTKTKPHENHRSFLASLILASIIPMSCDKILAFNYSPPIWGFRGHWWEAAAASFALLRNKLPLVCLSKPTGALRHTEKEVFDLCHTSVGTFYGWREGVSVWYLVMVDIYGKSYWRVGPPYYIDHRPSLVSWTSPDVHVGICNFGFLPNRRHQMWKHEIINSSFTKIFWSYS